jgi:hypothetical protein
MTKQINEQSKKIDRLSEIVRKMSQKQVEQAAQVEDIEPEIQRNAAPSLFGVKVARALWTRDELKNGRVGQRRRDSGRPALDFERQQFFFRACRVRFRGYDGKVEKARFSVNQRGSDDDRSDRLRELWKKRDA